MKNQVFSFDKTYIETFAKGINYNYVKNAYSIFLDILDETMKTITKTRPVVTDYNCQIVNECLTDSQIQNSTLDIFMNIKSPQLELGLIKLNKNYLKKFFNKIKLAWYSTKAQKQKRRWWNRKKRTKGDKKYENTTITNYTFQKFKEELMYELAKRFTAKTTLYVSNYGLIVFCSEDLGMDINLYICFSNGEKFTLFNETTMNLIHVDFKDREKNIVAKISSTNDNFIKALRIFNGLYKNINSRSLNQILIESILYNCPNELFEDNVYDMFIKLINFINVSAMQTFKSITDNETLINKNNLITQNDIYEFVNFLKNLAKLL